MHDRVIRQHGHDAPADALMAHAADPLLADDHPPVPAALPAGDAVAQEQERLAREQRRLAQARHHARPVDGRVGGAHAAAEVRLELRDGERVRHQGEGRRGGQAGAVFGEEVERRLEVRAVLWRGFQVEGEEDVVDGRLLFDFFGGWWAVWERWGEGGVWVLGLVDAVAVSGALRSVYEGVVVWEGFNLLFGFGVVFHLEYVDHQRLPVLTHVAEHDGLRLVK